MKIDIIRTFIAIAIGALAGWGYSALTQDKDYALPIGLILGLEIAMLCTGLFGIDYNDYPRSGISVRATCALGILLLLIINGIYAHIGINTSFYVVNGVLALLLLLACNLVYKSKQ